MPGKKPSKPRKVNPVARSLSRLRPQIVPDKRARRFKAECEAVLRQLEKITERRSPPND